MAGWRPIFRALHFCPLLCSGPLGAGAWLACRTVRICAWRFGFTSTFCRSSLRRREPKRKEAHGDRLSFHPYAFYLFVKVLSRKRCELEERKSDVDQRGRLPFGHVVVVATVVCRDSLDRRRSSFVAFILVFRKENLMACCGGCAVRDKNRNGTPSLPRSS